MGLFRRRELFILKFTKTLNPIGEMFEGTTSLPATASKEDIQEAYAKMIYAPQRRMEFVNQMELAGQKKDNEVLHGVTEKNKVHADKLRDSAKIN